MKSEQRKSAEESARADGLFNGKVATQLRIESGRGCKSLRSPATRDKLRLQTVVYVAHVPAGLFYLLLCESVCRGRHL